MQSLFYPEYGKLVVDDLPMPKLAKGEALVKVLACGICGSELETFKNKSDRRVPPLIMGHEFCGVIVQGDQLPEHLSIGSYVVSSSIISCEECIRCRTGQTNLCENRQVFGMHRNGAFAEYVNVPVRCLFPFAQDVDYRSACLTEPLANGVHIVKLTEHLPVKNILIIGAGPIGLMTQQAFRSLRETNIIVADIKDDRLEVAKRLGTEYVFNSKKTDIQEELNKLTLGEGVDIVIDAVGMSLTNKQAINWVRTGGAVVLIGLHENNFVFRSYDIILNEKKIIGSYAVTYEDMGTALNLISQQKVDVSSWVSYYPISKGVEAFESVLAVDTHHIKAAILFQ